MKKTTIFFAIGMLCSLAASAQGFYLRGGTGYAIPASGQTYNGNWFPYSGTSIYGQHDINKISFTAGLQVNGGIGYMVSKTFGFELSAMYNPGKEYSYKEISNVGTSLGNGVMKWDYNSRARNSLIALPSIVIRTGNKTLSGYARIGVALPVNMTVDYHGKLETSYASGSPTEFGTYHATIKHSFSVGYTAACGVQYSLNSSLKLYGEVNLLSLSPFVSSFDDISVIENGKIVEATKSRTYTLTGGGTSYISYSQPFGSAGMHVGVIFNLSPKPAPVAVPQ